MENKVTNVTEKIKEEYKEWKYDDIIFICSGTGTGKTTFILKTFLLYQLEKNSTILYLVPRTILKKQIEKDVIRIKTDNPNLTEEYFQNFQVWTYQYLEQILTENKYCVPNFDIIIADEFHYCITDATFNANTALSYDFIIKQNIGKMRILMTATSTDIMDYMINCESSIESWGIFRKETDLLSMEISFTRGNPVPKQYEIEPNYSYLDIYYIVKNEEIIDIVKQSGNKVKTLIFVSSKYIGDKLKAEFDTNNISNIFITSENKNTDTENNVQELINTNTFSEKVLITTSVLDVGVNFLDKNIENIVIGATTKTEFLQMLGRIRVTDTFQDVNLYICAYYPEHFRRLRDNELLPKIECIKYLEICDNLNNIEKESIKNNLPIGYKNFLYIENEEIKFNRLAAYYYKKLYSLYDNIYNNMKHDEDYFIKLQLQWLNLEDSFSINKFFSSEIQENRINELKNIIENEINKKKTNIAMYGDECKEIRDKFKPAVMHIDSNIIRSTNESLSIKKFNAFCTLYNLPYCIAQNNNKSKTLYYLLRSDDSRIEGLKLTIQKSF